ncbi:B-type cyclin [Coemansia spiralis]|uniref:B-type cyclin n=2 Tax=Coemansia TaxID=4863 RepID=A0A9W8GA04_9FUNG|nr:cyclin-like protein [Coemansia spiralis]KAJ1991580.1 B-type cyclin [Coemansia umbellata]KAJ2623940.1 B-type cyclin [Coemansia sp. RSA 1358]KAJ2679272.1 B-type cyclin [Coemansia spiralis]
MFQNKNSLPLRSRIPVRRTVAAINDENKVGGAVPVRVGKDEPTKAAGITNRLRTGVAGASAKATTAIPVKTFGASAAAGVVTRARTALGDVANVKGQGQVSKLAKPSDITAKIPVKAGIVRNGRVALSSIAKPVPPSARTRSITTAAPTRTAANPTRPATNLATRPISKPAAAFGNRLARPISGATKSVSASFIGGPSKRARSEPSSLPETASVLGKHTRSGGVPKPARSMSDVHATASVVDQSAHTIAERDEFIARVAEINTSDEVSSTAVNSEVSSIKQDSKAASPTSLSPADMLGELKLVEVDTIDHALSHTGLLSEHPIMMEEINEFEADVDPFDMTLIPEFSDDIFGYMRELEVQLMPNPQYITQQPALTWSTRAILVEWLVQVHQRFNLLPETLYLCINFVDRFLSAKEIVINKLQLVGAVCLLVASKYEEIHIPSVKDMEFMVEKNYKEDEILRAERYILRMLNFDLGWPGPLSFLRRISKADDYDMATRTLAKYLIEVTLIDERFIGVPCSKVAAVAHYLALRFLDKGAWTRAHAFYSGYFESELLPEAAILIELLMQPRRHRAIFEKYADRRYLRASEFVYQWFKTNSPELLIKPTKGDLIPEQAASDSQIFSM